MTSNGVASGIVRRTVDPEFLIFFAASTLFSGLITLLIWLTDLRVLAAAIPVFPGLLAVGLCLHRRETSTLRALLRSLVNGQVGGRWFAVSSLLLPSIAVLAILSYAVTGDADLNFGAPRVIIYFAALPIALFNELGWRGFAPLYLGDRRGLFVKSVIIGVTWFLSVSPIYFLEIRLLGDIPLYQLALVMVPMSILMFWLYANTRALLMTAVFAASGVIAVSMLPILPGDSAQGVTFWLVVGFLWLVAVAVVGYYGTDGLDRTIHELPPEELPVDWEKIMPQTGSGAKRNVFASGQRKKKPKPRSYSTVGKRRR